MLPPIYELLFQIRGSLLNSITPSLRAVTCDIDISCNVETKRNELFICFFYDREIDEALFDLSSLVGTEIDMIRYFSNEKIIRLDFPKEIPLQGKFAFLRKEPNLPEIKKENRSFLLNETLPIFVFLLDMQEALLGKVTPALRYVSVNVESEKQILFSHFVYDGEISEEDYSLATSAIKESTSSFPEYKVDFCIERVDFPNDLPHRGKKTVYWRRERDDKDEPIFPEK